MKGCCPLQVAAVMALLCGCGGGRAIAQAPLAEWRWDHEPRTASDGRDSAGRGPVFAGPADAVPSPITPLPAAGFPSPPPAADVAVLSLDDAIAAAIGCSPDLRAAEQQVEVADAVLARARSEFYPRLGLSQGYAVTNNPAQAFVYLLEQGRLGPNVNLANPGVVQDFQTQLLVEQGVYAGGRRTAETRAAAANHQAASFGLAAARNAMVFRVAEAYYRVFQARELVSIRRESVGRVERHLEIIRARYQAGAAVRSDVLAVEVQLAEVREAQITARHQLELARAVLENVCGARFDRHVLPRELPAAPWSGRVRGLEQAVAEARSRRPEAGAMTSQVQAAGQEVLAARAGRRPTAALQADYDVFTPDFARANDSWFVGVVVQCTLFDGRRTHNDVRQAEARLQELRARRQRLLLDIELDVRRSWLQLENAKQRLEVTSQAIGQAREALRDREIAEQFGSRGATVTELIDARVALSDALVRHTTALAEVEIARAALEQATGRLREVVGR